MHQIQKTNILGKQGQLKLTIRGVQINSEKLKAQPRQPWVQAMDSAQCRSIIPYAHRNTLDENEMNFKNNSKLAQNGIQSNLKMEFNSNL